MALARGTTAEAAFSTYATAQWSGEGVVVLPSCPQDDKEQHFDFILGPRLVAEDGPPTGVRVDVKALRKRHRSDEALCNTHTWIELQSADVGGAGHVGSTFGSADFLVFELPPLEEGLAPRWMWVPRSRLADWIRHKIDPKTARIRDNAEHCIAACENPTFADTLFNRRDKELLLWVSLKRDLKPLSVPVQEMTFKQLQAAVTRSTTMRAALRRRGSDSGCRST